MPDAKAHAAATLLLAGATLPLAVAVPEAGLVTAGVLAGLLVHPDLDQSRQPYWSLYARLRRHRGLSHWPVVGTLERAAWLLGPVALALWWAGAGPRWELAGLWLLGLGLADLLHGAMDWGERLWRSSRGSPSSRRW